VQVVVGNAGIWGERVAILSRRYNADVVELKTPAGTTFSYDALKKALQEHKPKLLFLCQGESSTGTHQVRSPRTWRPPLPCPAKE
jgi:alanine-glyoxylate transaminase/serine-glyoxylate transaminase/serine-pyruvate transaminase